MLMSTTSGYLAAISCPPMPKAPTLSVRGIRLIQEGSRFGKHIAFIPSTAKVGTPRVASLADGNQVAPWTIEVAKICNAIFEDLSKAGHDVRTIEDGETQFAPPSGAMPEHWKKPIRTIASMVATLRNAELFKDGSVLLPDGNYCYIDTCFRDAMEDDRNFGAVRKVVRHARVPYGPVPVIFDLFKEKTAVHPIRPTRLRYFVQFGHQVFPPDVHESTRAENSRSQDER